MIYLHKCLASKQFLFSTRLTTWFISSHWLSCVSIESNTIPQMDVKGGRKRVQSIHKKHKMASTAASNLLKNIEACDFFLTKSSSPKFFLLFCALAQLNHIKHKA